MTATRHTGRTAAATQVAAEVDAQSELGDVNVAGPMRTSVRRSLLVALVAVAGIAGFPLFILLAPSVSILTVWRIPLPWFLLAIVVYPVVWVLARFYDRPATRLEAECTVRRSARDRRTLDGLRRARLSAHP